MNSDKRLAEIVEAMEQNVDALFDSVVRQFLGTGLVVGEATLPMHHADPNDFAALQIGFRTHGITGATLVSDAGGAWQKGWYVIALTGLDDPLFLDAGDRDKGYPVYYAPHGAGTWAPVEIAPSLKRLSEVLSLLKAARDESDLFLKVLADETDLSNPFWNEVHVARLEADAENDADDAPTDYDPNDYVDGDLIVTDTGPHKLKVVQLVSKARTIALKDALALAAQGEFLAATGAPIQLRRLREQLQALDAKTDFRPHG